MKRLANCFKTIPEGMQPYLGMLVRILTICTFAKNFLLLFIAGNPLCQNINPLCLDIKVTAL